MKTIKYGCSINLKRADEIMQTSPFLDPEIIHSWLPPQMYFFMIFIFLKLFSSLSSKYLNEVTSWCIGLLLIHHRVNNYLKQMCASKQWKEENLPQLEHDGNTARSQAISMLLMKKCCSDKHHLQKSNVDNHRALLSCFGWLYAQASHLGFTPMTELTYPLATQVCAKGKCINVLTK